MLLAQERDGYLVCSNPEAMMVKAQAYGFFNIKIISYADFVNDYYDSDNFFVIDEIETFINALYPNIKGYSLTIGD